MYRPGDVVNGHVLDEDGHTWRPAPSHVFGPPPINQRPAPPVQVQQPPSAEERVHRYGRRAIVSGGLALLTLVFFWWFIAVIPLALAVTALVNGGKGMTLAAQRNIRNAQPMGGVAMGLVAFIFSAPAAVAQVITWLPTTVGYLV